MTSIRNVDEIIVLEKGNVIERGDNDSLVKTGGLYSRLLSLYETANDWRVSNEKLL
jgi:ABC transporter domain protein